jgi:hypothetical protein
MEGRDTQPPAAVLLRASIRSPMKPSTAVAKSVTRLPRLAYLRPVAASCSVRAVSTVFTRRRPAKVGADFRKTPVTFCILRKVDKGNAKTILYRTSTVGELYDAAVDWAQAQNNLPGFISQFRRDANVPTVYAETSAHARVCYQGDWNFSHRYRVHRVSRVSAS